MKSRLSIRNLMTVLSVLFVLTVGCAQKEIATGGIGIVTNEAEGRWHLVGITSGWTGKPSPPAEKVELIIDQQQQGVIYENGKEVLTYQYTLEETSTGVVRYSITQKTGSSAIFYPPTKGNFRLSTDQLIIGDTGIDGNDYIFERN